MSSEPDQSSGGSAGLARNSSQASISNSSSVPSKYCTPMVPSSSSTVTTSKVTPCRSAYHSPTAGFNGSDSMTLQMAIRSTPNVATLQTAVPFRMMSAVVPGEAPDTDAAEHLAARVYVIEPEFR